MDLENFQLVIEVSERVEEVLDFGLIEDFIDSEEERLLFENWIISLVKELEGQSIFLPEVLEVGDKQPPVIGQQGVLV